jgi:4-amino-4-deoxy-L-arabinose transferase-like glycosyltransferase
MKRVYNFIKNNPILIIILFAAFIVRFAGIFHDLPYSYYPDEEHFVNRAVSFGSGDLNPHWFHKPAFLMYLLFFEYGLYFVIGKVLGVFHSVGDFAISFFQSKGPFLFIGRLTVTLFGVATVLVTYLIGRDYWNKRTGLFASIFMAFIMGHVTSGQVVKADVPSAFFTVLSFFFIIKVYDTGQLKYYVLSGISAGLGMAMKYYAAPLVLTIFLAHVFHLKKENIPVLRNIINVSVVCFALGLMGAFFAASPYNFLDTLGRENTFIEPLKDLLDIGGKETSEALRFVGVDVERFVLIKSIGYYFSVLTSVKAMGIIGSIALVGMAFAIFRISLKNIIILSFPLLFIVIANRTSPFYSEPRHMNVIYPFMTLFAAYFIGTVLERFKHNANMKRVVVAVMIIILVAPIYRIVQYDYLMNQPDTRTLAKEWIEANIPSRTKILIDEESVNLSPDEKYYQELLIRSKNYDRSQFTSHAKTLYAYSIKALPEITYDLTYIRFPWWQDKEKEAGVYYALSEKDKDMGNPLKPLGVEEYKYYQRNGFEYAIVISKKYMRFISDSHVSVRFPSFSKFYKDLFHNALLIKEFTPDGHSSRGPVVKIFKFV